MFAPKSETTALLTKKKGRSFQGVSAKFQKQLGELLDLVKISDLHFVRRTRGPRQVPAVLTVVAMGATGAGMLPNASCVTSEAPPKRARSTGALRQAQQSQGAFHVGGEPRRGPAALVRRLRGGAFA